MLVVSLVVHGSRAGGGIRHFTAAGGTKEGHCVRASCSRSEANMQATMRAAARTAGSASASVSRRAQRRVACRAADTAAAGAYASALMGKPAPPSPARVRAPPAPPNALLTLDLASRPPPPDLATEAKVLDAVHADLDKVAGALANNEMREFLLNPVMEADNKKDVISKLAGELELCSYTTVRAAARGRGGGLPSVLLGTVLGVCLRPRRSPARLVRPRRCETCDPHGSDEDLRGRRPAPRAARFVTPQKKARATFGELQAEKGCDGLAPLRGAARAHRAAIQATAQRRAREMGDLTTCGAARREAHGKRCNRGARARWPP